MRAARACITCFALLLSWGGAAWAGGGPETTLVVVNRESPASLQVANAYVTLRGIPASHVCYVDGVPGTGLIGIDVFRDRIWKPIEEFLEKHGLHEEIDVIAYSADFPFAVNYDADFKGKKLAQGNKFRWASLTSVTYLIRYVKEKSREYLDLNGNSYYRFPQGEMLPAHGFRHRYVWNRERGPDAEGEADSFDRYYLSTMLGFTGVQGNSVPEIQAYLESGAQSDGTHPDGTVYLMENKDIRAKTRSPFFHETAEALEKLGRKVVRIEQGKDGQDGKVPIGKEDVIGCVAGIAGFNWSKSKSRMLPGAIAEHLTSFGARFDGSGQTKISAFLRAGAVGSSGAVTEPFAIQAKFPTALLHVYYARGCSLAESFYQSVSGPYQLLIIGDPLARPFANFAQVTFVGPETKASWEGTVSITSKVKPAKDTETRVVELWVDGQVLGEGKPGEAIALDTTKLEDGYHTLRLVAVEDSLVETRSGATVSFRVKNGARSVSIRGSRKPVPLGATAKLSGSASKATSVEVVRGGTVLATARRTSSGWKAEIDSAVFGVGKVAVQARGTFPDGPVVLSKPFVVEVVLPGKGKKKKKPRRTGSKRGKKGDKKPAKGKAGLEATVIGPKGKEHTFPVTFVGRLGKRHFLKQLKAKKAAGAKRIQLKGEFEVKEDGLYQFAINAAGKLAVDVQGNTVFEREGLTMDRSAYVALPLKAGWHTLRVEYAPAGNGDLSILLGGAQVATPLGGAAVRH